MKCNYNESVDQNLLGTVERLNWRIEDIAGADERLQLGEPIVPDRLAKPAALESLSPAEFLIRSMAMMIARYLAGWKVPSCRLRSAERSQVSRLSRHP